MVIDWNLLRLRADEQADLLSRRQCVAAGMSSATLRWRLAAGRWVLRRPGVYLTKPGRTGPDVEMWSALLAADPRVDPAHPVAAVAGDTAAYVWGLTQIAPWRVELVVPASRHLIIGEPRPRRVSDSPARTVRTLAPARTTLVATVLDCAASTGPDDALALAARAVQQRRTTAGKLVAELDRIGRHRHGALLRESLADIGDGAESAAEVRYVRDVERAHGLPVGTRRATSVGGRHDNLYPDHGLIVEVDGAYALAVAATAHHGWRTEWRIGAAMATPTLHSVIATASTVENKRRATARRVACDDAIVVQGRRPVTMAATLHIHREYASPERVVLLGDQPIGALVDAVTVFVIPPGDHFVSVRLGKYRSSPHRIRAYEGSEIHLHVEDNPDAPLPVVQGDFVRLRETHADGSRVLPLVDRT